MIRVYTTNEGRIITEYHSNGRVKRKMGYSSDAIKDAKEYSRMGEKVLIIDKEKNPGLSLTLLSEKDQKGQIKAGKKYSSKEGFDVIWSPDSNIYNVKNYDCVITIQKPLI